MLENTPENKAKFFALYWGQEVAFLNIFNDRRTGKPKYQNGSVGLGFGFVSSIVRLELTPLSQITDEDAIEIAKICDFIIGSGLRFDRNEKRIAIYSVYNDEPLKRTTLFLYFKETLEIFLLDEEKKVFQYDLERLLMITDYLRSKGYALPWMGLSVEQLVSFGWVKLKEG